MTNVKLQPHKKTTTGEALNDFIHLVFENHFTTLRAKRAKSVIVPTNRGKTGLLVVLLGQIIGVKIQMRQFWLI